MAVLPIATLTGHSLPPEEAHTITLHAPTWDHMVRFRNKDAALFREMVSMYPRFGPWNQAAELCRAIHSRLGLSSDTGCLPFLHPETVLAARDYAFSPHRNDRDGSKLLPGELKFRVVDIADRVRLYVVVFPRSKMAGIVGLWQNHGAGVTTRLAEDLLAQIREDAGLFRVHEFEATAGDAVDDRRLLDENKMPPGTWVPEVEAHSQLRERIVELMKRDSLVPETAVKLRADDVFLYPTGMAAIYYLHKILTQEVEESKKGTVLVLGSVFHNSWHVFEEESPDGFKHFGKCETTDDLDEIERWLEGEHEQGRRIGYLFVEFPSNPLLVSVDLARLRGWVCFFIFL